MISGSGADPVLVPGDLYHYPGGPQPAYPGAPPPANGYSVPVQGSGYPGSYDGPGGVDPGRYHPDSRLGGGHCNHLKDDCDCFKDDFSLPRKVSSIHIKVLPLPRKVRISKKSSLLRINTV